jgi:regulator of cell morphogenesis and NO signaling
MFNATLDTPIGRLAASRPEVLPLLERRNIDYCCGGDRTVKEACREAGVDPRKLLEEIDHTPLCGGVDATDWQAVSLSELCDHIEQTHHAFLREQLPFLSALIAKVVAVHGQHHPELLGVRDAFAALRQELEPHMFKEERVLFPAVRALEAASRQPSFPFGTIGNPIERMEDEHAHAGDQLRRIRQLTNGYQAPSDACNAYRGLLESLARLEADLHAHIHKENNIMFPHAIELENSLNGAVRA